MIHIAVLECDVPVDTVYKQYGSYGDVFQRLFQKVEPELVVSKWPVVDRQIYPNPENVDAILLSGSRHDAFSDEPWIVGLTKYIADVVQLHRQTPVVGICFGHQILARALGARIGRNADGWEIAVNTVNLTDTGRKLFGKDTLSLHQMHRDIVYDVPPGCVNLGSSAGCQIQGLYRPNQLLTVQGHPEFDTFITDQVANNRYEQKVFGEQLYNHARSRSGLPHDGELVGSVIYRFLLDCQALKGKTREKAQGNDI